VLQINNYVIALQTLLNVQQIINVYQIINHIYVNLLITTNVTIQLTQLYVQTDNAEALILIALHNQFVHHNSHYALIKVVN